jgi:hypothetical protein
VGGQCVRNVGFEALIELLQGKTWVLAGGGGGSTRILERTSQSSGKVVVRWNRAYKSCSLSSSIRNRKQEVCGRNGDGIGQISIATKPQHRRIYVNGVGAGAGGLSRC